ncbi:MAG: hypothetical protein K2O35_06155 [Clostridia bacterium]|nr:hypothetical protein [Clostridia bacterium]
MFKKVISCLLIILSVLCLGVFFVACSDSDIDQDGNVNNSDLERQEYLLSQMESISKRYTIVDKNPKEIVLTNYSLGNISIYDMYGNSVAAFGIENKTVYHNWYSIEEDENGSIQIDMNTVTRYLKNYGSKYDRALEINLDPFKDIQFASLNGEEERINYYSCFNENTKKLLYPVMTNVTQFVSSKVLSKVASGWNSTHTNQYGYYEILYIVVTFNDTTYRSATIMEYRFIVIEWEPYNFDSLLHYGEVL